ncbi:TetR/AcrR family transcriptional regulator [Streptomyces sp. NPDC007088]|uniref:TetR/AcrR family transcriptional regulator n=1 Tax=Streptomyces sp. NPDC007088 TaxID=3364773 RepID=UPI0036933BFD
MPRWEPNAAERLHDAALGLFTAQGYDQTTVAQIAAHAGLTERTFFNHFSSKREVLFGRTSEIQKRVLVREVRACPAGLRPIEMVVRALRATADEVLEDFRVPAAPRRTIIDATPELQEREEAKRAALTAATAEALRERGLDGETALLAAGAGLLIQQAAEQRWIQPGERRPLRDLITEALTSLRLVTEPE